MLKIILADNQAIFRTGVAKVLAVEDDLRIVAQADNSEKMMMALEKFHASVMIFGNDLQANLQDVVDAVLYLAEAAQVTGEVLHVDGGAHVGRW